MERLDSILKYTKNPILKYEIEELANEFGKEKEEFISSIDEFVENIGMKNLSTEEILKTLITTIKELKKKISKRLVVETIDTLTEFTKKKEGVNYAIDNKIYQMMISGLKHLSSEMWCEMDYDYSMFPAIFLKKKNLLKTYFDDVYQLGEVAFASYTQHAPSNKKRRLL